MTETPCGEPGDLQHPYRLWRQAKDKTDYLTWNPERGDWSLWPSPPGLKFDADGMSTAWAQHLEDAHGMGADDYATADRPIVFEVDSAPLVAAGFAAEHTPMDDKPVLCGHASLPRLDRPRLNELRAILAEAFRHVSGTITLEPPPGA